MDEYSNLSLYDIFDMMESRYGYGCDLDEIILQHPEDMLMKYYHNRLITFKVWEEQRKLYDSLDLIAQTMFITLTDRYGEGWNLDQLLKDYPDDELLKEFDSYLDFLERISS